MRALEFIRPLLKFRDDPNQPVLVFHELFGDLLTSPTRCPDKRLYIPPGKYHTEIAIHCLRLMNETLEDALSLQTRAMCSEFDNPPVEIALRYASVSWYTISQRPGNISPLSFPLYATFWRRGTGLGWKC